MESKVPYIEIAPCPDKDVTIEAAHTGNNQIHLLSTPITTR